MKVERRAYRMESRAAAMAETRRRLIAATVQLTTERPFDEVTLEAVATRAGVTLQTLLRHFGSKPKLVASAATDAHERVEGQRGQAPVGDPAGAVANLFDHYEEWGDLAVRLLAQEERFAEIAEMTRKGRATHGAWVARVFAPQLARWRSRALRARRHLQLVAACDLYVWKLLRRDLHRSRSEAEKVVLGLVEALCAPGGS